MSTFGDMVFHMGGVPVTTPVLHHNKAWFVKPYSGSDGNSGRAPNKAFKTLAAALAAATANNGEAVYLIGESNTAANTTDYQSAELDWNKDGVHLIGIGATPMLGQRCRIAQLSTVKTLESLFKVSANNCIIRNIEVFKGVASSTATAPIAVTVTGQRNHFINCQFSGNGDTGGSEDKAGARSLKVSGSENTFNHCYIGLDTVIRGTQAYEVEISGGARNIFEECVFNTYTSQSGYLMLSIANACDRFVLFTNCVFNAAENITSAVAPTALMNAIAMNGKVLLNNPYVSGFTNVTAADNTRVKILARDGTQTGHLMGIAGSVDVA